MEDLGQAPCKFEDTQPQVHDPTDEVNLSTVEVLRITYISSLLPSDLNEMIIVILREIKDCFAWNYDEIPGLDRSLLEHCLKVKVPPLSVTT